MPARRPKLVLKPLARDDVRGALVHTRERWGAEARLRRKDVLFRAMRLLLDYPELGRRRDELYAGCRSHVVGQHVIFYHRENGDIVVVRVLAGHQDAAAAVTIDSAAAGDPP